MGSLSDYAELAVLDNLFGATAMPTIGTHYFALSTTDFGETGAGGTEPSGGWLCKKVDDK